MPKATRPDDLAVLRYLDEQADTLRHSLGLHLRGEVVTWYESPSGDREFMVEADGYGKFDLIAYEGRNPNDRLEHHRATYDDEDAAWRAAMRLGEQGVAWEHRDVSIHGDDE
ncbi:MAG: hypothetical protein P4L84_32785 [Isosphaeraceae bacterium]|nr:hypothetical protein [Isosphaeraceae bacterium]